MSGLYAESRYGLTDVIAAVEQLEAECTARGVSAHVDGRDLLWKGVQRLYRSPTSVANYYERPTFRSDRTRCTGHVSLVRQATILPATAENLEKMGWSYERPTCPTGRRSLTRCNESSFADVQAICVDFGDGFVGWISCYSVQDDLSRNLRLGGSNYTDDGSGPNNSWGFDVVLPDVLIDPAVFDVANSVTAVAPGPKQAGEPSAKGWPSRIERPYRIDPAHAHVERQTASRDRTLAVAPVNRAS
ncbi:hypothetical protein [Allosphingosinicella deserti]|uniref:Uncharacterized protein n=1 Tax=Allosphingosinicella deserti TaxID=2116704 RepID=A0A2P7QEU5_9SPHN|nr:hypothetical protein [Sphingomonas deserti]PSJ36492.1 hypothetical protein C7I55_25815 [Sphingomonas deserti]